MQVMFPPWREGRAEHRYNLGKILHTLSKTKPHQLRFTCTKTCLKTWFFCLIAKEKRHTETAAMKLKQGISDSSLEPWEGNNSILTEAPPEPPLGVRARDRVSPAGNPPKIHRGVHNFLPPPPLGSLLAELGGEAKPASGRPWDAAGAKWDAPVNYQ